MNDSQTDLKQQYDPNTEFNKILLSVHKTKEQSHPNSHKFIAENLVLPMSESMEGQLMDPNDTTVKKEP